MCWQGTPLQAIPQHERHLSSDCGACLEIPAPLQMGAVQYTIRQGGRYVSG